MRGWLVPSAGQKIPVQPGWYLPPQKIPIAENRFFRQVRELKIRRKNPGSALWTDDVQFGIVPPRNAQVVDSRAMATRAMAVNLVVHSWMPSCPGLNWQKFFSGPLHWWDSIRRLEKVGKCNMLMKVCAAFCVLMMPFMPGMWRIHGWSA